MERVKQEAASKRAVMKMVLWGSITSLLLLLRLGTPGLADRAGGHHRLFLPVATTEEAALNCAIPGAGYSALSVNNWQASDRPAALHGDLNLALRGYVSTSAPRSLVDYTGGSDPGAPQLAGLFEDARTPVIRSVYRVYEWDWGCNCRGTLIQAWPVTLLGAATTRGETIHVPDRAGGDIGEGYKVLVLYASEERITLQYTREDTVAYGYTVHVENVCVDPSLLALYRALDSAGRQSLPALAGRQPFGVAMGGEVGVAIRDTGRFMDPRSRKDWWQGR